MIGAGVAYAELHISTPTSALFGASEGGDSKVEIKLPVKVLPGLYDFVDDVANWDPANVAIVGNFDPFDSVAAEYDAVAKRFDLKFTYTPAPTVPEQDTPEGSVPTIASDSRAISMAFARSSRRSNRSMPPQRATPMV